MEYHKAPQEVQGFGVPRYLHCLLDGHDHELCLAGFNERNPPWLAYGLDHHEGNIYWKSFCIPSRCSMACIGHGDSFAHESAHQRCTKTFAYLFARLRELNVRYRINPNQIYQSSLKSSKFSLANPIPLDDRPQLHL